LKLPEGWMFSKMKITDNSKQLTKLGGNILGITITPIAEINIFLLKSRLILPEQSLTLIIFPPNILHSVKILYLKYPENPNRSSLSQRKFVNYIRNPSVQAILSFVAC